MLPTFDLLDLQPTDDPNRLQLRARKELCTPFGFLYGGSGIAASIEAAERVTQRPLQWITTQFIGSPAPDEVIDLDVSIGAAGKATTQAQVTGTVDGRAVFTSLCAHTDRPSGDVVGFGSMPDVPSPDDCESMSEPFAQEVAGASSITSSGVSRPVGSASRRSATRSADRSGSGAASPTT